MAALRGDIRFRYLKQFFLVIYCSFKKRGSNWGELWCLVPWLSCFIGGVYRENHRPVASLTNFIHNVSSNKGVLIAGIYIHTTVYINLKNTPPSKPQSIELEIRPIFSTEGCDCTPPKRGSSSFVTQIRYPTPMKVVMVM